MKSSWRVSGSRIDGELRAASLMRSIVALGFCLGIIMTSGCARKNAGDPAEFRVLVLTGSEADSRDAFLGARRLLREYGQAEDGGLFSHSVFASAAAKVGSGLEPYIESIVADTKLKALVVVDDPWPLASGFEKIRAARPDILLFACKPADEPLRIQLAADLVLDVDAKALAYSAAWSAKELGARELVDMADPNAAARAKEYSQALKSSCGLVGLAYSQVFAPLAEKSAKDIAYFHSRSGSANALIASLLSGEAVFAGSASPSPSSDYGPALGLDLSAVGDDYRLAISKIEAALTSMPEARRTRFVTWPVALDYALAASLGEFARRVVAGKAEADSIDDFKLALGKRCPGRKWLCNYYTDPATRVRARNHILLRGEGWALGRGSLSTAALDIPSELYSQAGR